MNAFLNTRRLTTPAHPGPAPSMEPMAGWRQELSAPEQCEGTSAGFGSMAYATSTPQSPEDSEDLNKRRRLSHLLDRLAVQITNNNHYPASPWLMFDTAPTEPQKEPEDVPLDLSVKSDQTHSPPVPEAEPFVCGECGQAFGVHDRLAKHIASRHRNRTPDASRAFKCEICMRKFARSDMLTRHARLHTGIKPYSCAACGQVFSRSDHLATHQRTHTGEKPYRCSSCPYAACRRDMITRHMRTHTKKQQHE